MDSLAQRKMDVLIVMLVLTILKESNAAQLLIYSIMEEVLYNYLGITITLISHNITSKITELLPILTLLLRTNRLAGLVQSGFG